MNVSEIIDRHRSECESVRKLIDEAMQYHNTDFQKSKELMEFARLSAETMSIVQACECRVYDIDADSINLVRLAQEELAKRMRGR